MQSVSPETGYKGHNKTIRVKEGGGLNECRKRPNTGWENFQNARSTLALMASRYDVIPKTFKWIWSTSKYLVIPTVSQAYIKNTSLSW